MSRMKITLSGTCAAVLLTVGLVPVQGQTLADRSTIVTFSAPVSIPGVPLLPAGSYLFRLADSQANRNIVQIFDKDRTHLFATLLAVPAQRNEAGDDAVVTFKETRSDMPPAVHFWYYAGEKNGQEFAYPKDQATQIANASGESVLVAGNYGTDIQGMKDAEVSRIQPNASAEPSQSLVPPQPAPTTPVQAQPPVTTPTPGPVGTSGRVTSQPADVPASTRPERELPKTASELPLVGLLGLLALGGALAARALRRPVV